MTARPCARWLLLLCACLLLLPPLAPGCAGRVQTPEDALVDRLREEGFRAHRTERGLVLLLPDVLFDFDSDRLTEAAAARLATAASLIVELAPDRTLSIEGHSDSLGSEEYNRSLSLRRARSVLRELVAGGVEADRIVMVGYGERFPIEPNEHPDGRDNPEGRARNRRVEVVIESDS